ncbi:MAG TPA: hypothetical protein VF808_10285 [Ktedonobacterales bacterium]
MTNVMAQSAPVGHDPWDAPYFGGPVYLTYPAFAVAAPPPAVEVSRPVASAPAEPALVAAPPPAMASAAAPARRGWLARLFGRR